MPKKGAKKGGAKKGGTKSTWQPTVPNCTPLLVRTNPNTYYTVEVRGAAVGFLNFSLHAKATMLVFDLRSLVTARHGGSITDDKLRLYKDEVGQRNQLLDEMARLCDIEWADTSGDERLIFYDCEPDAAACPLLLRTPRNLKIEALHRAEHEATEARAKRLGELRGGRGDTRADAREGAPHGAPAAARVNTPAAA